MNMLEIGVMLKLTDQMTGGMRNAMGSLDAFGNKLDQLAEKSARFGRASMANGMIMMGLMKKPIEAANDLDDAMTNLRVAMMDNLGQIPSQFAEINKQAIELGNALPGTTADFANAATALLENGTALDTVVGGGLKAASYLSVVLKMNASDAAEMVAKFREAYGLSQNELTKMADLTQKAKFAFGLNPDDIKYAAAYSGSTLNQLGLTGVENAKKMLELQGYARQQSMSGSEFGTNFSQMLNQIGQLQTKLQRHSLPMRQTNEELARFGIHLQFFDKKGNFEGIDNLVAQMQKLRVLSQQERLFVTNRLFGMEGGRIAGQMIKMGTEGLQRQNDLLNHRADLEQMIAEASKSNRNTNERLGGTFSNLQAAFIQPAIDKLKPYEDKLNEITGGPLQKFVEEHKTMATVIGTSALAFGALAVGIGGVALAIGGLARAGSLLGIGKKGAIGAAGKMGGMPLPLPVYVVNSKMSLLPGELGGDPNLPGGAGQAAKPGKLGKLMRAGGTLLKWGTGAFIADQALSAIDPGDKFGSWVDQHIPGAAWLDNQASRIGMGRSYAEQAALYAKEISRAKQNVNGTIHIVIDQDGRAKVGSVNSSNAGLKFNAYAGHTMVAPQ
jgi:TP901 family phage tail tape measure protein